MASAAEARDIAPTGENEFKPAAIGALVACILVSLFSAAPIIGASFGVFMVAMAEDFGWGRAQLSGINFVLPLAITLLTAPYGVAMDRWGVRRVLLPAMALYGVAVMALALANGAMVQVYALYILVAIFGTPLGPLATSKTIAGWFHAKRGLALGLASGIGGGLGLALMPQIARLLFERYGWQGSYIAFGAAIMVLAWPLVFLLLREAPVAGAARIGEEEGAPAPELPGMTGAEARRSPTLWMLIGAVVLITLGIGGTLGHLIPMLTDRGIERVVATNILSFMALSLMGGQVAAGYLMDRFQTSRVAAPFFLCCLLGVVVLQHATASWVLALGGVLLGMGLGAETSMVPYFVTRYFGLRRFGQILGHVLPFSSMAAGLAPLFMGLMFDATGSYTIALYLLEAGMAAAIGLLLALGPFRYPATRAPLAGEASPEDGSRVGVAARL